MTDYYLKWVTPITKLQCRGYGLLWKSYAKVLRLKGYTRKFNRLKGINRDKSTLSVAIYLVNSQVQPP